MTIDAGEPVTIIGRCRAVPGNTIAYSKYQAAMAIGGFKPTRDTDGYSDANFNKVPAVIYFPIPGDNEALTLTCADNKGQAKTATAEFKINGPVLKTSDTGASGRPAVTVNPEIGTVEIYKDSFGSKTAFPECAPIESSTLFFGLKRKGPLGLRRGLYISVSGDPISEGSQLTWLQLIRKDDIQLTAKGETPHAAGHLAGIDGDYPYPHTLGVGLSSSGNNLEDSPQVSLSKDLIREERAFYASSYLMWTSSKLGAIPVPIAIIDWHYTGVAIPAKNTPNGWGLVNGRETSTIDNTKPATSLKDIPRYTTNTRPSGPNACPATP